MSETLTNYTQHEQTYVPIAKEEGGRMTQTSFTDGQYTMYTVLPGTCYTNMDVEVIFSQAVDCTVSYYSVSKISLPSFSNSSHYLLPV